MMTKSLACATAAGLAAIAIPERCAALHVAPEETRNAGNLVPVGADLSDRACDLLRQRRTDALVGVNREHPVAACELVLNEAVGGFKYVFLFDSGAGHGGVFLSVICNFKVITYVIT